MASPGAYYERPTHSPSPWVPATILGIILLVATTPYRMTPDVTMSAYHPGVRNSASFIPPGLIWIPVIFFLLFQFFGGRYRYDRLGGYGDTGMYPGVNYNDVNFIRYNGGPYADRGVMSSYGGHWILILLGFWLFSLVGSGTAPTHSAAVSTRLGFPWSLFAPQPQVVMPIL